MKKQNNLRRVFLTWNNWQDDFTSKEVAFNYFKDLPHIKAFIIGFEVGEQGTEHIQGVFQFTQQKTFNTLRTYFKNNHIEKIHNIKKSIEYCKKEGDYLEYGDITIQGQRTDIENFTQAIIEGYSDYELLLEFPSQTQRFVNNINKIRQIVLSEHYQKKLRHDLTVIYISGEAGAGKTKYIYDTYNIKDIYRVSEYKNPFDNYNSQSILVLDEYNNQIDIQLLLNILDIYPLLLPARYNNKWACYNKVYIISNYEFDYIFKDIYSNKIYNAINRRVHFKTPYMTKLNTDYVYKLLDDFNEFTDSSIDYIKDNFGDIPIIFE